MTPSWDLRQLECFLAVAEEQHFRRAAERMHLSPATVSEAIAALERRLGGRLFDRSTRRVRLTEHGEKFLDDVREPYQQLRQAHEAARARSRDRAEVVLAYTPELGSLFLPSILARVPRGRGRGIAAWRPVLMHTNRQIPEIEDGTVDIGLCWSVAARRPLHALQLGDVPMVAILREDDRLADRSEIPLNDLRKRRLLVTPHQDNPFIDSRLHAAFVQAGVPPANIDEASRYDELLVQVATGDRIGVHPGTIVLINSIPGLVFRRVIQPTLHETIVALARTPARHAGVATLLDIVAEVAGSLDIGRLGTL